MQWSDSDAKGRQGIAISNMRISMLGHQFREQPTNDVGIDAHVELVDIATNTATGQLIALQIKGGPSYLKERTDQGFTYRGNLAHLEYWLNHSLPVFLILVDTVQERAYWQEISDITVEKLDKGWKVTVPFTNVLDITFVNAAKLRAGLEANVFSYTRLSLEDTSTMDVKRYRAKLLMRQPLCRLRAEAIVRKATADLRKESYNLKGFKQRFGDQEASVISLFVAGDLHDTENINWYCRTMWVSKDLATSARPLKIGGEDLGDGLEVVWNMDYAKSAQFYRGLQIDKQSFLAHVHSFTIAVDSIMKSVFGESAQINCRFAVLEQSALKAREMFLESGAVGLPPYECKDVAQRFQDVMAIADNAFIYATKVLTEVSNAGWQYLLEVELRNYRKNLDRLEYELEKVR